LYEKFRSHAQVLHTGKGAERLFSSPPLLLNT
jgi:hypothetical protein